MANFSTRTQPLALLLLSELSCDRGTHSRPRVHCLTVTTFQIPYVEKKYHRLNLQHPRLHCHEFYFVDHLHA
jgi:hypothetical protein